MAIEEALLAENGVLDTSFGTSQTTNSEAYAKEIQEVTALDRDQEYYSQNQVVCLNTFVDHYPIFVSEDDILVVAASVSCCANHS